MAVNILVSCESCDSVTIIRKEREEKTLLSQFWKFSFGFKFGCKFDKI